MVQTKHYFLIILTGFLALGFSGGMIYSHYQIPLNYVMPSGLIIGLIGVIATMFALRKLRGLWEFEVVED